MYTITCAFGVGVGVAGVGLAVDTLTLLKEFGGWCPTAASSWAWNSLSLSITIPGWGDKIVQTHTYLLQSKQSKTMDLFFYIRSLLCLLLVLSSQAGRSWQWPDCPLQPECQRSRLASRPGWGSGPPPRCCGGVQLTYAASLLFRPGPEKTNMCYCDCIALGYNSTLHVQQ